jgi:DNA repair protein RadC
MIIYEIKPKFLKIGECENSSCTKPQEIAFYMKGAFDERPDQEAFFCILFDSNSKPIGRIMLTLGIVNQAIIHPREAFRFAVQFGAVSIAFAHNHPSGNLNPSPEDIATTNRLCECGKILDIPVIDHVILGEFGFRSIRATDPNLFK